jgi:hypothetical protein
VALLAAVHLPAGAELPAGMRQATLAEGLASLVAESPAELAAAAVAELAAELAGEVASVPASAQLQAWLCATHGSGLGGACAAARKAPKFVSFSRQVLLHTKVGMPRFSQAAAKHYDICIVHRAYKPSVLFRGRQT